MGEFTQDFEKISSRRLSRQNWLPHADFLLPLTFIRFLCFTILPVDLRGETKAPRIARKDGCWKDVAWIGKRSSLFRHQRRIPPRRLAQKEHPLPHSLPSLSPFSRKQLNRKESANYDLSPCFWTICFLVCDFSVILSRPPYCSLTIVFVSTRIKLYLKFNSVSYSKVSKNFLFRFCL